MPEFSGYEPPIWQKFLWGDDIRSTSWIPIGAAIDRLAAWEPEPQVKAVEYLKSGIWTASFQRARILSGTVQMSPKGGFTAQLNSVGRSWNGGGEQTLGTGVLGKAFWHREHAKAGATWSFEVGFIFPDGARLELNRGEIEAFHGAFDEDLADTEFVGLRFTAHGVGISEFDVDATAPARGQASAVRQSSFDWESAFADVAAEFYHDLQFEDVNARGVSAKVIEALRRSFEARKLKVPENSSLKSKARILVGALRSRI